jgi:hypothetical protein
VDQEQAEQQDTAQDMMSRDILILALEEVEAEDSDEDTGDEAEDSGDEEYIRIQDHITLNHIQNRVEKKKKTTWKVL